MTQLTSSNQVMLRKHIGSIQFRLQIVKMESSFLVLSENRNLDSSSRVVVLSEKVNKGLMLSQVERKERKFSPRISDEVYYSLLTSLCRPFWCPLLYPWSSAFPPLYFPSCFLYYVFGSLTSLSSRAFRHALVNMTLLPY